MLVLWCCVDFFLKIAILFFLLKLFAFKRILLHNKMVTVTFYWNALVSLTFSLNVRILCNKNFSVKTYSTSFRVTGRSHFSPSHLQTFAPKMCFEVVKSYFVFYRDLCFSNWKCDRLSDPLKLCSF